MTLTGTNFLAGVTVSIGGVAAANVTIVAERTLTATTAAHVAGAVNVVMTNPDAQNGTVTNGFTYVSTAQLPSPTPALDPTHPGPPLSPPGAPFDLTSSVSGSAVSLSWAAPPSSRSTGSAGSAPTSYVIEAGSFSGGGDVATFSTGNLATSFTADPVSPGTYFVRARAMNSAGTSPASNEVIVTVGQPRPGGPGAPSGLVASVNGSTVTFAWNAATSGGSPTAYLISAGSSPGLSDLAGFSTGSAATSFTVGSVPAGTFYVRIRAANIFGTSAPSNEVMLVVSGSEACSDPPSAPTGLRFTLSGSTVTLAWNASAGSATSYVIEEGSFSGSTNIVVSDTGSTRTRWTATDVGRGTYFVRLRGQNSCGTSTPSNEVVIIVP